MGKTGQVFYGIGARLLYHRHLTLGADRCKCGENPYARVMRRTRGDREARKDAPATRPRLHSTHFS